MPSSASKVPHDQLAGLSTSSYGQYEQKLLGLTSMTMVNKKGITQSVNNTSGPSKQARKAGIVRATSEKKQE
jgi:RNase P/RNase MRP subunit POP5